MAEFLTDEAVEEEIARLQASPYVKLARKEEHIRTAVGSTCIRSATTRKRDGSWRLTGSLWNISKASAPNQKNRKKVIPCRVPVKTARIENSAVTTDARSTTNGTTL